MQVRPQDDSSAAPAAPARTRLRETDAEALIRRGLARLNAEGVPMIPQLRGLIRAQLLTATEEIMVHQAGLFVGYSVTTYSRDAIVSLVASANRVAMVFPQGLPAAFEAYGVRDDAAGGSVMKVGASMPDALLLKVVLREVRRASRPRLPNGRTGQSFQVSGVPWTALQPAQRDAAGPAKNGTKKPARERAGSNGGGGGS